jgi:nicotinamidase/pyrazinamidase
MTTALLIVDVQNDFVTGTLPVPGGAEVASGITELLASHRDRYALVAASQDWHDQAGDNGGHFATIAAPDYVLTWPRHCVAGEQGSAYHPALDASLVDLHVRKGQGSAAYSMFEAVDATGMPLGQALAAAEVDAVDVTGLATDYCVRATALDARAAGLTVRLLTDLVAGVADDTTSAALAEMAGVGVELASSKEPT